MENESRAYKRGNNLNCAVKISVDGKNYIDAIESRDISSSGIKILSNELFNVNDKLYIKLFIQGIMTDFDACVEGTVARVNKHTRYNSYGIKFSGLNEDAKIRIDENIINDRIIESRPYLSDK